MDFQSRLSEVKEAHAFDEASLSSYLKQHLEGFTELTSLRQFQGGQSNPTFLVESSSNKWVLRKKPPGKLLPSAHLVEREHRVMAALRGSGVPVPEVHLLCEDPSIIGAAFYVMEHVEGRLIRNPLSESLGKDERTAIFKSMAAVLARLHSVDYGRVGLADYGKVGGYAERQVRRWTKQYEATKTDDIEAMRVLIDWLSSHIPAEDETSLTHGDYRLDNLIIHPKEPTVIAVLDWELSTLGHPISDLAYNCLAYHLPTGNPVYKGLKGVDLAAAGIPDQAAYVALYCEAAGRPAVHDFEFFLALSLFRSAAIVQGVYARALAGNASSENAKQVGAMAKGLADLGRDIALGATG